MSVPIGCTLPFFLCPHLRAGSWSLLTGSFFSLKKLNMQGKLGAPRLCAYAFQLCFLSSKIKLVGSSLVAQWIKDLVLSLLWCGFESWPEKFCMPAVVAKKRK